MIELVALFMGLISWILLLYCIFKHRHFSRLKTTKFQAVSWSLCSVALYFPSLSQQLEFLSKDYDGIIDCVSTFHLASLLLLLVTFILSITLLFLSRKSK